MIRHRHAQKGFSLIEALIAMALMGIILAGLSTITAQWLPNWNRGLATVQSNELLERGLERVVSDLSAAEYVPINGATKNPLFMGSELSVTFVRRALGPNTRPGLEIVRIAESTDQHGSVLIRTRARFTPASRDAGVANLPPLKDPVVLLRAPYRVTFSYAGEDRAWKPTWQNSTQLPRAVRLLVRDSVTQRTLPVSTTAMIHVDSPPACQGSSSCGKGAPAQAGPGGVEAPSPDNASAEAQQ